MLNWIKNANETDSDVRGMFVNGAWKLAASDRSFESFDPSTGDQFLRVSDAGQEDVDEAISAAVAAQEDWASLPPAARAALFHRAADLFVERQEQFANALIKETGSSFGKAMFECSFAPLTMREAAALTTREIGETYPSQVPGKVNRTIRTPVGVVGVISPWNFPLYLSLRGFVYALALGNTAVLKPAEDSPVTGGLMLAELFADAGFPAGVLNVVTASREGAAMVGSAFVKDPRVNVISFTGSAHVGKILSVACASVFKPIVLELGGKNPIVVLNDADLDRAVDLSFFGSFLHQGQICMSADRIIVACEIYDDFLEKLVAKTKNFVPTSPEEQTCVIGPIINNRQLKRIEKMVEDAKTDGAEIHCGGKSQDSFYEATIITNTTPEMAVWKEEIFGPVVVVLPFDDVEQAISIANDTQYGLSASIITGDTMHGEVIAERIHAGMIHINDSTVHDEPHCPFGGLGASGGGGKWGPKGAMDSFTVQRWVSTQRVSHALPF